MQTEEKTLPPLYQRGESASSVWKFELNGAILKSTSDNLQFLSLRKKGRKKERKKGRKEGRKKEVKKERKE